MLGLDGGEVVVSMGKCWVGARAKFLNFRFSGSRVIVRIGLEEETRWMITSMRSPG